jgi:hypothetical protein
MRFTNWLLVLPTLCLGVVILTSFVIFFAFRRGRQVISQVMEENADDTPNPDAEMDAAMAADTRWARGELAVNDQPETIIEMAACPACGGENIVGAGACAYCGRKL